MSTPTTSHYGIYTVTGDTLSLYSSSHRSFTYSLTPRKCPRLHLKVGLVSMSMLAKAKCLSRSSSQRYLMMTMSTSKSSTAESADPTRRSYPVIGVQWRRLSLKYVLHIYIDFRCKTDLADLRTRIGWRGDQGGTPSREWDQGWRHCWSWRSKRLLSGMRVVPERH